MRQDIIFAATPSLSELTKFIVLGHLLLIPLLVLIAAALGAELLRGHIR